MEMYDALIIGGGASGLMCAIAAKRKKPRLRVAVLEKNDRVGKKLLATGNGRCNLTHTAVDSSHYAGSFRRQSQAVFDRIGTAELLAYFRQLGLLTACDSEGRYYPLCRQASAVLDVLRFNCEVAGAEIVCSQTIRSVKHRDRFTVTMADRVFQAEKLVIAAGSKASPKLGGSGSAADMLKNLGHRFVPFSPALCPVSVQSGVLKSLKGLRAQGQVMLLRGGKTVKAESGEVQFNEQNLSGICVFDLSLYAHSGDEIVLDLLPDISERELNKILLQNKKTFAAQSADNLFTGILQKRVAQAVLKAAGCTDFAKSCAAYTAAELQKAAQTAKAMRFSVTGNEGFDRAQACLGGVYGGEIDEMTMRSKKQKNLWVCGEAIDLCGECGGYNLHFAFASGMIAGENL